MFRGDNLGIYSSIWSGLALRTYNFMTLMERRTGGDRRRTPRGGRRATDRPGRHPQILIADSYDGARIPWVKYLDRLGFEVLEARNGHKAMAHIDAQRADVIV